MLLYVDIGTDTECLLETANFYTKTENLNMVIEPRIEVEIEVIE